jgi:hypothetical protein
MLFRMLYYVVYLCRVGLKSNNTIFCCYLRNSLHTHNHTAINCFLHGGISVCRELTPNVSFPLVVKSTTVGSPMVTLHIVSSSRWLNCHEKRLYKSDSKISKKQRTVYERMLNFETDRKHILICKVNRGMKLNWITCFWNTRYYRPTLLSYEQKEYKSGHFNTN